ncbi:MAG: twin-arginine translocase TatA/TatE family subunit [Parachlamydiaceae bacterium]|nr:twin-arginine translocase TatA/TatE family subunit [Parachlamydiaceae bacterium]
MFGTGEILVILFVVLILFGGKKLPEFAQSLGKGIREFKKACYGEDSTPTQKSKVEDVVEIYPAEKKEDK